MKKFKKILVYASTETGKFQALRRAEKLAAATGAQLKVVDVVPDEPLLHPRFDPPPWVLPSAIAEKKKEVLEEQVAKVREAGVNVDVDILFGKPFVKVVEEVLRGRHDLVMKTVHQKGLLNMVDSTAMDLLRNCPCPVELVRPSSSRRRRRVLACLDPMPDDPVREEVNTKVMELAAAHAAWDKAELHVLHAWHAYAEAPLAGHTGLQRDELDEYISDQQKACKERLDQFLSRSRAEIAKVHMIKGDPARIIPKVAHEKRMDLVVMGTLSRSGIAGFLIGNTAEKVVAKLEASLLTVKPDGFVCPVKASK